METKLFSLNHFKALYVALEGTGASANLDIKTYVLTVTHGDKNINFYPQFLGVKDGKKFYTPTFSPNVKVFIGWMPYFNKRWDLSNEKLNFKEYCVTHAISTPAYSTDISATMANVLVKSSVSSFGYSIHGPFASSADHALTPGQYYESYKTGKILKIWYWNEQIVCLESQNLPFVIGDGKSTLRELLLAKLNRLGRNANPEELNEFLKYKGTNLESVIPEKQEISVDYRYGSNYYVPRFIDTWSAATEEIQSIKPQLSEIGQKLWNGIPEALRHNTLFTVDAIQDDENKLWCLEMNSNPIVHPFAYPHMIDTLLASKSEDAAGVISQPQKDEGNLLFH